MRVLVTNDDGIHAKGIEKLAQSLGHVAEVTVVAPEIERSAVGHAITLNDPLRVEEVYKNGELFGYAVNGTPADCVKIGISAIMDHRPDAVFSGINPGTNIGTNAIYSGTVSAAIEGSIMGCCSAAISVVCRREANYDYAQEFAPKLLSLLAEKGFPKVLLNVNIPEVTAEEIKGVRLTKQGRMQFREYFDRRQDPSGRTYYWLTGELIKTEEGVDVDSTALENDCVSITPIHYDLTDRKAFEQLRDWRFEK
jgi:5'-nucleotidase